MHSFKFKVEKTFALLVAVAFATATTAFVLHRIENSFSAPPVILGSSVQPAVAEKYVPPKKLSNPPEIIKAVYVTGYSAGSKKYITYLNNLLNNTEINAVVIDIKDYSGMVSYNSGAENVKKYSLYNGAIKDIDGLVRTLHDKNIYIIGRIAVFEDPGFSKSRPELAVYDKKQTDLLQSTSPEASRRVLWQDNHDLSWLDPASKDVWDYNISLAKDALGHGLDEINFDYVRFPSDGKTKDMGFPVYDGKKTKAEVIKEFFNYLRQNLLGNKISVDLFGQTTTNTDDMGIGQLIEDAFENFDYISPMVYPSHYITNFIGFVRPADHPYEIVKYSIDSALAREKAVLGTAKFRPWLQDFNMGAIYNADMVKLEIKATQDALGSDYNGYMLWNPSNIYTKDAVLK